ncbi:MAG: hypothetical protein EPO08_10415 [Rhodospirillaceae bacterium]|nr:MAG: hypothetical protein EPO08_10415 [Rhodospirillaceae bacterium]
MKPVGKRLQLACVAILYAALAVGTTSSAFAKLEVQIESGVKPGEEWITAKNWCQFAEDAFIARVTDGGQVLASIEYCATYGKSDAQAFTDKNGRGYVLIERNTERGTHAIFHDLEVYRIVPGYYDGYDKIVVVPVEEPAGPCHEVRYAYEVGDSPSGGLKLSFTRQVHRDSEDCPAMPDNPLRPDKARVIVIDAPE